MLLNLRDHAPQARCYECGSPQIASTCHHCGRCMCRAHTPRVFDAAGKPSSREFTAAGLEDRHAGAFHCAEHDHVVRDSALALIIAGAVLLALGILATIASIVVGLLLVLAGGAVTGAGVLLHQRRKADAQASRPPLPILPSLDSVTVTETLSGKVLLGDDGTYASTPEAAEGIVEIEMTLARADRERLGPYRSKYGLEIDEPVEFSAGFGVIDGEAGLIFREPLEPEITVLPSGTAIALRGNTAGHPLFSRADGRPAGKWTARLPYRLHPTRAPRSVPIWLVPSLVPASDKRTLELDLHWVALGGEQPGEERRLLAFDRFEVIELIVPKKWGNVESVSPTAFISNPESESVRTIQWKQLSPESRSRVGSQTLTIRFEKQISLDDKLVGSLQASFGGTLSGMTDLTMYRPTGGPWHQPPESSVKMEASVEFELSLNSIRYQDVRVVPNDPKKDWDRPEVDEFPGVIPDYLTVIELTNELSDSGYYVKRVIENPPRGGPRAELVNRYWDIAGRQYDGVFPIDFHITLVGEEEHRGSIRANAGNTAARLSVHGSYVNREMEEQVEREWDTLRGIVDAKLGTQVRVAPAAMADPSPTAQSVPQPRPAPAAEPDPERASVLRGRLEAATDKLLSGLISEETYRMIEASVQAELNGLHGQEYPA